MIIDILKDSILANIGPLKSAPKNWHKRNCMLCHTRGHGKDKRNRFGIQFNSQSIAMNCFNCGFSAGYTEGEELSKSFKFFLKNIGIDDKLIKQIEFEVFKSRNGIKVVRDGDELRESRIRSLIQKWKPKDLPEGSLSIKEWLNHGVEDKDLLSVAEYAISRHIYDLDKFYWSPLKTNNINERLIIPYYYKKEIVGYTCRLYYDVEDKSIPKYYQQSPTDFVYNLDNQQDWERKFVILTEGVLDAWAVDGIATLGEIGQAKIDIINRLQKTIVVCPDRDKKGGDLVKAAIDNNWMVSFPKWDNDIKDAAKASEKYGKLLTLYSIIKSAVSGREKIELKWRIEQSERNRMLR